MTRLQVAYPTAPFRPCAKRPTSWSVSSWRPPSTGISRAVSRWNEPPRWLPGARRNSWPSLPRRKVDVFVIDFDDLRQELADG